MREPRLLIIGGPPLDHNVLTFDIAQFAQPFAEGFGAAGNRSKWRGAQESDPRYGSRLLRLDDERRGERAGQRGQQETSAVHAGTVGRMVPKVNLRAPR